MKTTIDLPDDLLIAAKKLAGHGRWKSWAKSNLKFSIDKAERLMPPEPKAPIDIESITPQTLEVSSQQLRKLGLNDPDYAQPDSESTLQADSGERRRPFFHDGKEYALWILDHPEEADPDELEEIKKRLRKDSLYRTWLGREDAASA